MSCWTNEDFDALSWHDNHIHGLAVREGEHGTGQLIFDLDFIVEWLKPQPPENAFRFLVAPADLVFNDVSDLRATIAFASMAMGPFSIQGIERSVKTYPNGFRTYAWLIPFNFPRGEIAFVASGFTQALRAAPIAVDRQRLMPEERLHGRAV